MPWSWRLLRLFWILTLHHSYRSYRAPLVSSLLSSRMCGGFWFGNTRKTKFTTQGLGNNEYRLIEQEFWMELPASLAFISEQYVQFLYDLFHHRHRCKMSLKKTNFIFSRCSNSLQKKSYLQKDRILHNNTHVCIVLAQNDASFQYIHSIVITKADLVKANKKNFK